MADEPAAPGRRVGFSDDGTSTQVELNRGGLLEHTDNALRAHGICFFSMSDDPEETRREVNPEVQQLWTEKSFHELLSHSKDMLWERSARSVEAPHVQAVMRVENTAFMCVEIDTKNVGKPLKPMVNTAGKPPRGSRSVSQGDHLLTYEIGTSYLVDAFLLDGGEVGKPAQHRTFLGVLSGLVIIADYAKSGEQTMISASRAVRHPVFDRITLIGIFSNCIHGAYKVHPPLFLVPRNKHTITGTHAPLCARRPFGTGKGRTRTFTDFLLRPTKTTCSWPTHRRWRNSGRMRRSTILRINSSSLRTIRCSGPGPTPFRPC